MGHMRDGGGNVEIAELRRRILAGIHAGNPGAAGVMGGPFGDVVDFTRDDDPAIIVAVVPGDLFGCDAARAVRRFLRRPQRLVGCGMVGLGCLAEVPRPQLVGRQHGADIAGVIGINPVVVFTAAFVMGEGGADPFVEPF